MSNRRESAREIGDIEVYGMGLIHCSICAANHVSPKQVEALVNLEHPSGTSHGWVLSKDSTFASGAPNPSPCDEYPVTRTHYLLAC